MLLLLMVIALYALPVVKMVRPVDDADIWWHLRTGQWIVEHGAVPQTDPFSAYGQGRTWLAYSWLYEVVIYGCYHWFGLYGVLAFRLITCGLVLVAVHHFVVRREPNALRATVLTFFAFIAMIGLFYERPWLFTILFWLFTLTAVLNLRAGTATRAVWLLPLAFVLWANLHIQFIYGLALLGLACAVPFADALLKRPLSGRWADTPGTPAWRRLVVLTAACAAATLVNPYHARLYGVVYEYASQPVAFQMVHELQAPLFRLPADWDPVSLADWAFLAMAGLGAFALGRRPPRSSVFELLLYAGAVVAGFRARRDIWLVVLVALTVCTAVPRPTPAKAAEFAFTRGRVAIITLALVLVVVIVGIRSNLTEREMAATVDKQFPAGAVRHIREKGYPGPLWNIFDWGGYLIWALPEYPVSMDGRTNLQGDERLARHYNTARGLGWEKDDELMKTARLVIVNNNGQLAAALRQHPHFELVYKDDLATVFIVPEEGRLAGH
jgi:hypothetical protein